MKIETIKQRNKLLIAMMLGMLLSVQAFAQSLTVTGVVKDNMGEAVIGANVVVKGTTNGTITDFDGNFTLTANKGDIIVISFIGYQPQELPAAANMNVILKDDSQLLDDVVVIGYGTVKKDDATGSVTAIKPDKISKGITTSPQDMITGKIAGVNVVSTGGTPGAGATIRVRGGSSLNASNDPLIVIDGLAMDNDGVKGMSNPLSLVNPNDIETFTVLKDASATAIYGSRASNGVIIITTKKGSAGSAPKVSYDGNVSFGKLRSKLDVMTGDEYREYVTNLYGEEKLPHELGTANTDWQDEIYRTAISHDHNITISGGLKNMPYRVSLSYTNQNGIIKTSNFERFTASVNLAPAFFDNYLKFNINAKSMVAWNQYADGGVVGSAITMDPTRPVYDNSTNVFGGYYQWSTKAEFNNPDWLLTKNSLAPQNPVALLDLKDDQAKSKSFIGNIEVDYKFHFLPDLRIHANLGADYSEGRQTTIISPYSYSNNYYGWNGTSYEYKYNLSGSAYLQYIKDFNEGKHALDVMVGMEEQHFHRTGYEIGQGTDPVTGDAYDERKRDNTAYGYHSTLLSYFGRINYTFLNRYLLTATLRQDGTSRFDSNNRWGTFPSFAFGWKMKEESFLQDVDFLSDLKLRLGWGITGQQNLSNTMDFPYMALYTANREFAYLPMGDQYLTTLRPGAYNPDLKWEETTTWNAGIDFGFLNGRITGTLDYYYRETNDLINTVYIPTGMNFSNMLTSNVGSLRNQGVEFSINAKPIVTDDFVWDLGYNITWNNNKITKLTASDDSDYYVATGGISTATGSTIQAHKVGYAASSFYVYQQVYDENGKPVENTFVDRNHDGMINDSDRYIYKKPSADVLMGLTSKMTYKNWDFSFAFRASIGNYVYNDVLANRSDVSTTGIWSTSGFYSNRPTAALDLGFSGVGNYYMSDYFVQNASFLRCDNITLGYSFQNLFKTNGYNGVGGRIYATVQNPFVITGYDGLDPEVQGSADTPGIDNNIYPRPVTFLIGLSLQF
ncbi:TonB-dependent receptor [Bacteroides caecicola]|uniref:TonB-dependent receptor n=1 Tax=Bacteroides caecicola TaxID=1462569 RepID=A0ABS2F683_9BACE|nr:TonB-dependent receptor [Bacteroides caecicola]MBM6805578.1 TonB-dependent receptor [Bacteroides caecicola]